MAEKIAKFTSNDARFLINSYGFSIFPVWGIDENMNCMCGDVNCTNQGKHPATPNGCSDSTNNIEKLLGLWAGRKGLNVGIATGKVSNCFVVDVDGHQAEQDLQYLINIHGELPQTLQQTTGRGRHLFFKYPPNVGKIKTRRGVIGDKIDIRGDGGYVVGYKSTHKTGATYNFVNPLEDIEEAPQWLIDIVLSDNHKEKTSNVLPLHQPKTVNIFSNKSDWSKEQIQELLTYISPDCGYDEWYQIGMAIKDYGLPFEVWDNWSKGGTKYINSEMPSKWNSFNGSGVSIGTLVYHAKQGGWKPTPSADFSINSVIQENHIPDVGNMVEIVNEETGEITYNSGEKDKKEDKRILPLIYADEVQPVTACTDFVEDLLRNNEFSVIYGASNCGKTFFMLDLAMHVALGKEWRGKEVEQGGVIYAALEGGHGTKNRIVAFREHYKITDKIPLAIIPSNINFLDGKTDMPAFLSAIKEAQERMGSVKMIVVDTLARAIAGGDENSSMDMGQLIINADKIREVTNAHIAFVHHSGKDDLKGARGHSSLRAAVDTEIEISRPDTESPSTMKVVKQREMEMIDDMSFSLSRIVLGVNERGKEVTSCVALPCDTIDKKSNIQLTPVQSFVYDAIVDCVLHRGQVRTIDKDMPQVKCVTYDEVREVMESRGHKKFFETEKKTTAEQIKSATFSARAALKKKGKINMSEGYIWLVY